MTKRVRTRRSDGRVSPRTYWWLLGFSPLIMLIGMAAGGVLVIRSILIWDEGVPDHHLGIDIPISGSVLLLWAGAVTLLLRPPPAVLAGKTGPFTADRALVWPLGRQFRFWIMFAAPFCGVLAAMSPFVFPGLLGGETSGFVLWLGLIVALGLSAFTLGLIWVVLRGALHGVELTPSHLIARGYFWTRRFPRREIVSVNATEVTFWASAVLEMLLNRHIDGTLRLSLIDGSERILFASNSHRADVESGAEVIRAWRIAGEAK